MRGGERESQGGGFDSLSNIDTTHDPGGASDNRFEMHQCARKHIRKQKEQLENLGSLLHTQMLLTTDYILPSMTAN